MSLCLNMIVKNESERIERALASAAPHIAAYVILDTGSTDGTPEKIRKFFEALKIPGDVLAGNFYDFSQARNDALRMARQSPYEFDYILLMDADMELRVKSGTWADHLTGQSYDMMQQAGSLIYQNRRLVKRDSSGEYLGVTHEFLNVDTAGLIPAEQAYFYDHADGSNRPDKYKRDIRLLKEGLRAEPNNARYMFYIAQSYRDAGNFTEAAKWYKKRVEAGGWDEEVWNAQLNYAHCQLGLKNEDGFVSNILRAYNMRPTRAEALYDLAKFYRLKGENNSATAIALLGLDIPISKDALFVNDYVYSVGLKEEFAICAYYTDKRAQGFEICNELALKTGPYGGSRDLARTNMYWYLPTFSEVCSSFKWHQLDFEPPEHWIAMNPSVTVHDDKLYVIIRTVNYNIDDMGRYLIRATDGTANDANPISTRNYLAELDPIVLQPIRTNEIHPPVSLPAPLFKPVIGFEDMRLFSWRGRLWTSSCVREMNSAGYCEQVLGLLKYDQDCALGVTDLKRMIHEPREYEKNWVPITDKPDLQFMYRPGEVVDANGATVRKTEPLVDCHHMSGGSQIVPCSGGYLALVHEARLIPGGQVRYYAHRFVFYDVDLAVVKISKPFVFHDKGIEFAAGMCIHPTTGQLVISYGYHDNEARIATVDAAEVTEWLWSK